MPLVDCGIQVFYNFADFLSISSIYYRGKFVTSPNIILDLSISPLSLSVFASIILKLYFQVLCQSSIAAITFYQGLSELKQQNYSHKSVDQAGLASFSDGFTRPKQSVNQLGSYWTPKFLWEKSTSMSNYDVDRIQSLLAVEWWSPFPFLLLHWKCPQV